MARHRRRRRAVLCSVALALMAACSSSGTPAATTDPPATREPPASEPPCAGPVSGTQELIVDGEQRSYDVSAPAKLRAPAPLLVILHGFSSSPAKFEAVSGLMASAADAGLVAVSPAAGDDPSSWGLAVGYGDDAALLDQMMEEIQAGGCIDGERIWLVGFSAGSGFAGLYGCGQANEIQGMVLVSGLPPAVCPEDATPRVVVVHGTEDPVVPFAGGVQSVNDEDVALPSIPESVAAWAARAGCGAGPAAIDSGQLEVSSWFDCASGGPVDLVALDGGGHAWPGDPALQDRGTGPLEASCLTLGLVADPAADIDDVVEACPQA